MHLAWQGRVFFKDYFILHLVVVVVVVVVFFFFFSVKNKGTDRPTD